MQTLAAFHKAVDWAKSGVFTQQDIDEAKLSVFSVVDSPVAPADKGQVWFLFTEQNFGHTHEQGLALPSFCLFPNTWQLHRIFSFHFRVLNTALVPLLICVARHWEENLTFWASLYELYVPSDGLVYCRDESLPQWSHRRDEAAAQGETLLRRPQKSGGSGREVRSLLN